MGLRCNICAQEIEEKDLEVHLSGRQHAENKERLGRKITTGSDLSVVMVWKDEDKGG